MKITIDTKEDSHEELRKVIKMLSSLVGEEVMNSQSDIFSDSSAPTDSSKTGNSETANSDMFSDDSSKTEGSDMFSMFNSGSGSAGSENPTDNEDKKEEKDDIGIDMPNVEEYR